MEIWKLGKNGRWYISAFRIRSSEKPLEFCFEVGLPSLGDLLLEELGKKKGERWVVFDEYELRKISMDAGVYLVAEEPDRPCTFLDRTLDGLRRMYRKRFTVTYVTKRPSILSTRKADRRLSIHIES